jgi:hypothetical protein
MATKRQETLVDVYRKSLSRPVRPKQTTSSFSTGVFQPDEDYFNQLREQEKQRLAQEEQQAIAEDSEFLLDDYAQVALKGLGQGVAGIPKGLGIAQSAIGRGLGFDTKAEETALYGAGEWVEDLFTGDNIAPEIQEEFGGKVANALGQIASFLIPGGLAGAAAKGVGAGLKGISRASTLGTAVQGAGVGAAGLYEEAGEFGQEEGTRLSAAGGGALLGLTEAIPFIGAIGKVLGPAQTTLLAKTLNNFVARGAYEGVQEGLQTIGENYIAKEAVGYDPDRALLESATEAAQVGGTAGVIANAILSGLGYRVRRNRDTGQTEITDQQDNVADPTSTLNRASQQAKVAKEVQEQTEFTTNEVKEAAETFKQYRNTDDIQEQEIVIQTRNSLLDKLQSENIVNARVRKEYIDALKLSGLSEPEIQEELSNRISQAEDEKVKENLEKSRDIISSSRAEKGLERARAFGIQTEQVPTTGNPVKITRGTREELRDIQSRYKSLGYKTQINKRGKTFTLTVSLKSEKGEETDGLRMQRQEARRAEEATGAETEGRVQEEETATTPVQGEPATEPATNVAPEASVSPVEAVTEPTPTPTITEPVTPDRVPPVEPVEQATEPTTQAVEEAATEIQETPQEAQETLEQAPVEKETSIASDEELFERVEKLADDMYEKDKSLFQKLQNYFITGKNKPSEPTVLYRGVPRNTPVRSPESVAYEHVTPWGRVAISGGKIGGPQDVDIIEYTPQKGQKYYRGGSLEGDPLERTAIGSAEGYTWDQALKRAKQLYNRYKNRAIKQADYLDNLSPTERKAEIKDIERRAAENAVNDFMNGTYETDALNRPGKWVGKKLPRVLNRIQPKLRTKEEIEADDTQEGQQVLRSEQEGTQPGMQQEQGRSQETTETSGVLQEQEEVEYPYEVPPGKVRKAFIEIQDEAEGGGNFLLEYTPERWKRAQEGKRFSSKGERGKWSGRVIQAENIRKATDIQYETDIGLTIQEHEAFIKEHNTKRPKEQENLVTQTAEGQVTPEQVKKFWNKSPENRELVLAELNKRGLINPSENKYVVRASWDELNQEDNDAIVEVLNDFKKSIETRDFDNQSFEVLQNDSQQSPAVVLSEVNKINNFLKSNPNLDDVNFYFFSNPNEIQDDFVRDRFINQKPRAMFVSGDGKYGVYVDLARFKNSDRIKGAIIHELVGHVGLRKTFGPALDRFLDNAVRNKRLRTAMQNKLGNRYSKLSDRRRMEEYIAELAREKFETGQLSNKLENSFFSRLVAKIKHIMMKLSTKVMVTDKNIESIINNNYNNLIAGRKVVDTPPMISDGNYAFMDNTMSDTEINNNLGESIASATPIEEIDIGIKNAGSRGVIRDNYRKYSNKFLDSINRRFKLSGMANVNDRNTINILERMAAGKIDNINDKAIVLQKKLFRPLIRVNKEHVLRKILAAWQNGTVSDLSIDQDGKVLQSEYDAFLQLTGINKNDLNLEQLSLIKDWNNELIAQQGYLIENNDLDATTNKTLESIGTYTAKLYEEFFDQYRGSGLTPSIRAYLRHAGPDVNKRVDKINDPQTILLHSVMQIAHDSAKLTLFDQMIDISNQFNKGWVLGNSDRVPIELNAYPFNLPDAEVTDLGTVKHNRTYAGYMKLLDMYETKLSKDSTAADAPSPDMIMAMREDVKVLKNLTETLGNEIAKEQNITKEELDDKYIFIDPKKRQHSNLGDLRGMWIDREIYQSFFGTDPDMTADMGSLVDNLLSTRTGRKIEKYNAAWKAGKTLWNIPAYWPRAWIGTAMMMDMATDTNSLTMAKYYAKGIRERSDQKRAEKFAGKTLYEWAIESGAGATSFGEGELYQINNIYTTNEMRKRTNAFKREIDNQKTIYSKLPHMGFIMMSENSARIVNMLSRGTQNLSQLNATMDLDFKSALMRDFIEKYRKTNKGTPAALDKLNENQMKYLMNKALEFAATGVPEYNINIPKTVEQLRRSPFGAPFLTFNYKLGGMMADAVINRPQKFIKYPLLAYGLVQMAQLASGMTGDDYEEAAKASPAWTKNKTGIIPIPLGRDPNNDMTTLDLSYVVPMLFYVDMIRNVASPPPGESSLGNMTRASIDEMGLFGGVVPQIMAASVTGVDPFTKREIAPDGLSASEKGMAWGKHFYNLMTIPALSNSGALGDFFSQTGISNEFGFGNDEYSQFGTDKQSWMSDLVTNMGFSVRDYRPVEQRIQNKKWVEYQVRQIDRRISELRKQVATRNISQEAGIKKIKEAMARKQQFKKEALNYVGLQ